VLHQVERNAGAGAPETGAAVHGHHACVSGARAKRVGPERLETGRSGTREYEKGKEAKDIGEVRREGRLETKMQTSETEGCER
jgi:hypothetical protein